MPIPFSQKQLEFIRGHETKVITLRQQIADVETARENFMNYVLAENGAVGPHKLSDDGTQLVRDEDPTKKTPPKENQKKKTPARRTRR